MIFNLSKNNFLLKQRVASGLLPRKWVIFLFWCSVFLLVSPLVSLVWKALTPQSEQFLDHLQLTVLKRYLLNTSILVAGVLFLASLWGISCAWLIALYRFPFWRWLRWMLLLPLAMPSYIAAYIYTDFFDYTGGIQRLLRAIFGWENAQDYFYFSLRNLAGATFILSLLFYPYIYLAMRSTFAHQGEQFFEASAHMGYSTWKQFFRLALPLARPAWVAAAALVAMETIADFGLAHYFGLQTLTQAVYDAWVYLGDLAVAAKISVSILTFLLCFLAIEHFSRRKKSYAQYGAQARVAKKLTGKKALYACLWCFLPLLLGFLLPFLQLVFYLFDYGFGEGSLLLYLGYSLVSALAATFIALIFALLLSSTARHCGNFLRVSGYLCRFGYALPGVVLAIALLLFLGAVQKFFDLLNLNFNFTGYLLSSTLWAVIFVLVLRFLSLALNNLDMAWKRISAQLDQAAVLMGHQSITLFWRVHFPLLKPALCVAALLVFIESMKELSAVLLLAPLNFLNLATYVYQYVSEEQMELVAGAALLLVFIGITPAFILSRNWDRYGKNTEY